MTIEKKILPQVAGAGGPKPEPAHTPVEAPDSLQSRAMINVLDLLGEGEIGGLVDGAKSIFLNGTPLENPDGSSNFSRNVNGSTTSVVGLTWIESKGTQHQEPISGFTNVATPYPVSARVRKDTPFTISIDNPNVDQVSCVVTIPALATTNTSTGDINGASVEFKFEIATTTGGVESAFVPISGPLTLTGKSKSRYQKAYTMTLPKPASSWKIRMSRQTDDSISASLENDTYFDSYVELINTKLSYPNSALVGVSINSEQFSAVPSRSYLVNGLYIRVPSNYNATTRVYTGVWDGTFHVGISSNPAWILFDLLTSKRYGLGEYIDDAQVDTAALYKIGRYCDEMVPNGYGGLEPRFSVNTVINSRQEAFKIIANLTSAFRGMAYWTGGAVGFTQDAPTATSMVFSQANVVDGIFNYTGSARKDRHSVALITWNDPTEQYKQKIEYVENAEMIARYGIRQIDMIAYGCISRSQAHRAGLWMLYTEQFESDLITFNVGLDAALVLPGEVVKIHDRFRAGKRLGGRIISATTTSARLDSQITLDSSDSIISMRLPDGSFVDRDVLETAGQHLTLTWTDPLPDTPQSNSMWIVTEPELVPILARVIGISQGKSLTEFTITAMEHNPSKFAAIENGLVLEAPKTSQIDAGLVTTPIGLTVTETQYEITVGILATRLHISWSGTSPSYEIRWRRTGDEGSNWETITTTSNSIDLENVRKATYEFSLVGVNAFGRRSSVTNESHAVVGKTTAPGDVANFKVERRVTDLLLTWDAVRDIEAPTYEVRVGDSWDTAVVLTTGFTGTMLRHDQDFAGSYLYQIRSVDRGGRYSDNVSSHLIVLDPPLVVEGFDCVQSGNTLVFRWRANQEQNIVGYEIREGVDWTVSILIAQVNATSYTMPAGATGDRIYWIRAIASPGIYSTEGAFVNTAIAQPSNVNIVERIDQSELMWPGARHNLSPIGPELLMVDGVQDAEYVFPVDLLGTFRAQNTLFGEIDSLSANANVTWASATFAWDSTEALRQWAPSGQALSVSGNFQIAPEAPLAANEIDGFHLDGNLFSVHSVAPTQAIGVTYDKGRFGKGIHLTDTTLVKWPTTIPPLFAVSFWVIPNEIKNCVFWRAVGAGISLYVGYSTSTNSLFMQDQNGNIVTLPFNLGAHDVVCIGVSQQATTRRLLACKMNGTAAMASGNFASQSGNYTDIRLY